MRLDEDDFPVQAKPNLAELPNERDRTRGSQTASCSSATFGCCICSVSSRTGAGSCATAVVKWRKVSRHIWTLPYRASLLSTAASARNRKHRPALQRSRVKLLRPHRHSRQKRITWLARGDDPAMTAACRRAARRSTAAWLACLRAASPCDQTRLGSRRARALARVPGVIWTEWKVRPHRSRVWQHSVPTPRHVRPHAS